MASDEIYEFTVTTPAGTLASAPLVTRTTFPNRIVERIKWRVPAGALGSMGWRISMNGVPVIPRNAGAWIIAHEKDGEWPLRNQPTSGDWSVTTYNTGSFSHALYVTYYAQIVPRPLPVLQLADQFELSEAPEPQWALY